MATFEAMFLACCLAVLAWILLKVYLSRRSSRNAETECKRDLGNLFARLPLGIIRFDRNGGVIACNDAGSDMTGWWDRRPDGLLPSQSAVREEVSKAIKRALLGEWGDHHVGLNRPDEEILRLIHIKVLPSKELGEIPEGGFVILEDTTERLIHEDNSKKSGGDKCELLKYLPQVIYQLDFQGKFVFINTKGLKKLGLSNNRIDEGISFLEIVIPEDRARMTDGMNRLLEGNESVMRQECTITRPGGSPFPALIYGAPIVHEGIVAGVAGLIIDVGEFRNAEESLRASLSQSEAFVRKIHHRVKNDLQILSSLLYLQSRQGVNDRDEEIFRDMENRIMAMALVHDTLCRSESPDTIDLRGYLQDLVDEILSSYEDTAAGLRVSIDVQTDRAGIDTAIPLGLIVSELVGKFIKRSEQQTSSGRIGITLKALGDDRAELTVKDETGSYSDSNNSGMDSQELNLVRTLVGQLRGQMDVDRTEGTTIRIEFQIAKGQIT